MFKISKRKDNTEVQKYEDGDTKMANDFRNIMRIIATIIFIFLIAFICLCVKANIEYGDKESGAEVEKTISGELKELQEFVVAKVTCDGVVKMEDSEGWFDKTFWMKYKGEIKAYVDFSDVKPKVDYKKRTIKIKIPHAEIENAKINSNDLEFYDKSWIKSNSIDAATKAIKRAEEDCNNKVDKEALKKIADEYAIDAVKNLFSSFENMKKPYKCTVESD